MKDVVHSMRGDQKGASMRRSHSFEEGFKKLMGDDVSDMISSGFNTVSARQGSPSDYIIQERFEK